MPSSDRYRVGVNVWSPTVLPGEVDHARYGGFWLAIALLSQITLPRASVLPGSTTFHTRLESTLVTGVSWSAGDVAGDRGVGCGIVGRSRVG